MSEQEGRELLALSGVGTATMPPSAPPRDPTAAEDAGHSSDEDSVDHEEGSAAPSPAAAAARPAPSSADAPWLTDELHALASRVDYGIDVAKAIAMARRHRPLHRVVLKNLHVKLPAEDGADAAASEAATDGAGSGRRVHVLEPATCSAALDAVVAELKAVSSTFDTSGDSSRHELLCCIVRELVELCSQPPSGPGSSSAPPPTMPDLSGFATAMGSAMATALASAPTPSPAKPSTAPVKMTAKQVRDLWELAEAEDPDEELDYGSAEIANRTLLQTLSSALVDEAEFPTDAAVSIDKMAALGDAFGVTSGSDVGTFHLDASTGTAVSGTRDPVAKDAKDVAEYIEKATIRSRSMAFVCSGLRVGHIPEGKTESPYTCSKGSKSWCSMSACMALPVQMHKHRAVGLTALRWATNLCLRDAAERCHAKRKAERYCPGAAMRWAAKRLAARLEQPMLAVLGGESPATAPTISPAVGAPPAASDAAAATAAAEAEREADEEKRKERAKKKRERDETRRKEKTTAVKIGEASVMPKAGGYDEHPKCKNPHHFAGSVCAFSHKHLRGD